MGIWVDTRNTPKHIAIYLGLVNLVMVGLAVMTATEGNWGATAFLAGLAAFGAFGVAFVWRRAVVGNGNRWPTPGGGPPS